MPVPDVRWDPATGLTQVGSVGLDERQLLELQRRISKVRELQRAGYGHVPGQDDGVTYTLRFAQEVLVAWAPPEWEPGMKPILDGGG